MQLTANHRRINNNVILEKRQQTQHQTQEHKQEGHVIRFTAPQYIDDSYVYELSVTSLRRT